MAVATAACSEQPSRPTTPSASSQPAASQPVAPEAKKAAASDVVRLPADLVQENNNAVGLMGRFDFKQAEEIFRRLQNRYPDEVELTINLAVSVLNQNEDGKQDEALRILKPVIKADPDNLRARYCAGLIQLYLGQVDEPLANFKAVAEADPSDPYAAYYLGQCLESADDYAAAAVQYEHAVALDIYLRSAYLGMQRCYGRIGRDADADKAMAEFERLGTSPRSKLAQFKYTRMGSRGMATVLGEPAPLLPDRLPEGPMFQHPIPLVAPLPPEVSWRQLGPNDSSSITVADINADGRIDVFISNALVSTAKIHNALCLQQTDGSFTLEINHPLAQVDSVNAALWGDVDNDGFLDVYLCRQGPNQLWKQSSARAWSDITDATHTASGSFNTVDGALADLDHDGDLDIYCVNADAPNELLNNNLDGTFRPLGAEAGVAGDGRPSRQVLIADLDHDRDADIVVLHANPPHEVFLNDRLWKYTLKTDALPIQSQNVAGAVWSSLTDGDADLLLAVRHDGNEMMFTRSRSGDWAEHPGIHDASPGSNGSARATLILQDAAGLGSNLLISSNSKGWYARGLTKAESEIVFNSDQVLVAMASAWVAPSERGPSIVGLTPDAGPLIYRPGPGRSPFTSITFRGVSEPGDLTPGQTMRSNASGIGTTYAARIGDRWVEGSTFRASSGPGQSLQPASLGLDGSSHIDFLQIDWSDGVFQSEVHGVGDANAAPRNFSAGTLETIVETQRQISSCPVLFAHNGSKLQFVTDLLGVGGIGYMIAPHEYAPSRPWENVQLPPSALAPVDGRFIISLTEPMEEACYLDAARLVAWDLPAGWNLVLDERMGILGPEPTGEPRFYRTEYLPSRATNERGEDVTSFISSADLNSAPVGPLDHRFIGRLAAEHILTLEFGGLASTPSAPLILIADGWVEYPYCQTMFAAWQAGADYRAASIDARTSSGEWITLLDQFGYPAGMPRRMSVPLPPLPEGCTALRLRTNQEIYWDRLSIAEVEPCPEAYRVEFPLREARCEIFGYPRRTTGPQRQPFYDADHRTPYWDCRHQPGFYTAFGNCTPLLANTDDALAIFGPGEGIRLEFDTANATVPPGSSRTYILETNGWCKDMDLFTGDGETLGPIPHLNADTTARDELHRRYNTRYEAGR